MTAATSAPRTNGATGWLRSAAIVVVFFGVVAATYDLTAPRAQAQQPDDTAYVLIINRDNSTTSIDRAFVAQAFLKKIRKWPNGETIDPVDQAPGAPVRRRCSTEVLGRSVDAVRSYWQQMIFSGRDLPPPEMPSDADVVDYVVRKPGAIGYVSASANLRGAHILTIR
ncbi:MAG: hypothetical protein ABUL77_00695 [Bacteroidota bacterium]